MACGCPVIISKNVNISNEISSNDIGQVVDIDSNEIAKEIINFYFKSDEEKKELKQKIRDFSLEHYSWDKSVRAFKNLYVEVIN